MANSAPEADAHRAQQKALLAALGAWDRALRRDEYRRRRCGPSDVVPIRGLVTPTNATSRDALFSCPPTEGHSKGSGSPPARPPRSSLARPRQIISRNLACQPDLLFRCL